MTYVIGDVHGSFNTLKDLLKYFSKTDTIIFVGDLIDRGHCARQTVKFIRENGYKCVLGNHETVMIEHLDSFLNDYPRSFKFSDFHMWLINGGKETLLSYELIKIVNDKITFNEHSPYLDDFIDDLKWMKSLPLYLELEHKINNKDVVVSHSCISNVWDKKDDKNYQEMFERCVLWDRQIPNEFSNIFNIFGHTKVKEAQLKDNYINIDTGCYYKNEDYGKLTAFCIDDQEVISIKRSIED